MSHITAGSWCSGVALVWRTCREVASLLVRPAGLIRSDRALKCVQLVSRRWIQKISSREWLSFADRHTFGNPKFPKQILDAGRPGGFIFVTCEDTFTLSYITGRSVGIGAYLNRLGQRNIQMAGALGFRASHNSHWKSEVSDRRDQSASAISRAGGL